MSRPRGKPGTNFARAAAPIRRTVVTPAPYTIDARQGSLRAYFRPIRFSREGVAVKSLRNTFLLIGLLTLVLALVAIPSSASGQPSTPIVSTPVAPPQTVEGDPQPYIVRGIATKEQRSIIASIGAGIEEEGADYVLVRATPTEIKQIRKLGYVVESPPQLAVPLAFPSADRATTTTPRWSPTSRPSPPRTRRSSASSASALRTRAATSGRQDLRQRRHRRERARGAVQRAMQHAREHLTVEMALYLLTS